MAKVQIKQWVIFLVVATWLLTTLSACGGSRNMPVAAQGVAHTNPNELWGTWACNDGGFRFSRRTEASGVEVVVRDSWSKEKPGFGFEESYIVDRKPHQLSYTPRRGSVLLGLFAPLAGASGIGGPHAFYAATSNLKTPEGHKIYRVVKRQGVFTMKKGKVVDTTKKFYMTRVNDYFVKNRHLYHRFWEVSSGGPTEWDKQPEWDNVDNFKPNDKSIQEKCVRER